MTLYGVLKFVHVLSVVAWVGGSIAMSIMGGMLLRARDRTTLGGFIPQMFAYSRRIGVPASLLVLITGFAMLAVGSIGFMAPWVVAGYAGLVLHFVIGSTLVQWGIERVARLVTAPASDDVAWAKASRQFRLGYLVYLVILASVIAAMVMKPTQ